MTAAGVIVAVGAALLIGFALGFIVAGWVSANRNADSVHRGYVRGFADGTDALVIGENDRLILECARPLTREAFAIVQDQWESGARTVILDHGIRVAAVERRPDVAEAPALEIREREA